MRKSDRRFPDRGELLKSRDELRSRPDIGLGASWLRRSLSNEVTS